ncbi:hypothetical protein ODS41_10050 [Pyrobaculum sp. 3827-6]|uniref:hypothetical protein n=1 Tax=Pyrobaculum sp. 3827-6 TaxID=2983604 RepID=UPI0021DA6079|nr:hypothetical protein [Pyrobaculum sp. 3827-6]MCU7788251.1 hypothetical protein [Pyrobaculum sp. 3827-6]
MWDSRLASTTDAAAYALGDLLEFPVVIGSILSPGAVEYSDVEINTLYYRGQRSLDIAPFDLIIHLSYAHRRCVS